MASKATTPTTATMINPEKKKRRAGPATPYVCVEIVPALANKRPIKEGRSGEPGSRLTYSYFAAAAVVLAPSAFA